MVLVLVSKMVVSVGCSVLLFGMSRLSFCKKLRFGRFVVLIWCFSSCKWVILVGLRFVSDVLGGIIVV